MRSQDLKDYLDRRVIPYLSALEEGEIDFKPFYPLEKIEVIHFLSNLASSLGQVLTYAQLETLFHLLATKSPKKQIQSGDLLFQCHLGYLSVDKVKSMC